MHSFKIYSKDKTKIMTGRNTAITLDGVELQGVMNVHVDIKAGGLAKLVIEMYAKDIDIDGRVEQDPTLPSV